MWKYGKYLEIWNKIGNLEKSWKFEKKLKMCKIWIFGKILEVWKNFGNLGKKLKIWKTVGNLE